jgi:glycosyltransferase involved in cell wall biosynthesis
MSRPLRILQCVGDIDPAMGGSVEAARQLSLALAALGHTPELLTLRPARPEWSASWSGTSHCAGPAQTRYLYSSRLPAWVSGHAADYDAVLIHGLWRYTSVGVWRGLRQTGVPYFVFPHGMLDPYFRRACPGKHLQKLACWLAGERCVLRDARAVFFACQRERERARRTFRPYACREKVVGLGILPPPPPGATRGTLFARFPELLGKRLVLFLGRLHPKKGCDLLLQAFARLAHLDRRLHLVMAGPDQGGWQARLQKMAQRCGIAPRVTWTGPLYGDRKWDAMRAAEVFALPSHAENFGIAVAEALGCGLPVLISSQVSIAPDIVADGAGFVAPDDLAGSTAALAHWLKLPEERREAMRGNARRSFIARYDSALFAAGVLDTVISELAGARPTEVNCGVT